MSNEFGSNIDGPAVLPTEVKYEPAVIRDPPKPRPEANRVDTRPRVRIELADNENIPPTGQFFGVQGIGTMLRPGVPANVPASIIDILNNAIMSVPVVDPVTKQVTGFKDRLRFPYRILPKEQEAA